MEIEIGFDGHGIKYPTTDGRTLKLRPGPIVGTMHLRFEHKEKEFDIGSRDVIAADLRIPDVKGLNWLTTMRFTSRFFLRHTLDLEVWDSGLFFLEDCKPEIKESLEKNLLLQNIFCGDDIKRSYTVCISNKPYRIYFKLSQCTLDVAAHNPNFFIVKVNDYSILSDDDYIGNFAYLLPIDTLLKNNTAVFGIPEEFKDVEGLEGSWMDSAMPLPLYFESTGKTTKPQITV